MLAIGLALAEMFKYDDVGGEVVEVKMTRSRDVTVALSARAAVANNFEADLFISLHCNASEAHVARGFEVWTSPGQTQSDIAADLAYASYMLTFPYLKGRRDTSDGDNDREARFTVLTATKGPAILFEFEFIDSAGGERFLTEKTPEELARPIFDAALQFLGIGDPNPWRLEPPPGHPAPSTPSRYPASMPVLECAIVEISFAEGIKAFEDAYNSMLDEVPPWTPQGGICFAKSPMSGAYVQAFTRRKKPSLLG